MRAQMMTMVVAAFGLHACDRSEELRDVGVACLTHDGVIDPWGDAEDTPTLRLEDGDEGIVVVMITECESGSVDWEDLSCSVELVGDVLTTSSYANRVPPGPSQTDDCNVISVECGTPALEAGLYTLSYGGGTAAFEVPWDDDQPCAEGAAYTF